MQIIRRPPIPAAFRGNEELTHAFLMGYLSRVVENKKNKVLKI